MAHDIFVSYASADEGTALAVVGALEKQGLLCWIALRDIPAGEVYPRAIIQAIEQCRCFLLLFTAHSNRSQQVLREVERAVHRRVPVLSFRIDEEPMSSDLEYFLSVSQWQNAFPGQLDQHLPRLVHSVAALLERGRETTSPRTGIVRQARLGKTGPGGFLRARLLVMVLLVLAAGLIALAWLPHWKPTDTDGKHGPPEATPLLQVLHVSGATETAVDAEFPNLKCGDELRLMPSLRDGRNGYVLEIVGNGKTRLYPGSVVRDYNGGWGIEGPPPSLTLLFLSLPAPLSVDQGKALEEAITALGPPPPPAAETQLIWGPGGVQLLQRGARGPQQVRGSWAYQVLQRVRQLDGVAFQGYTLPVESVPR